MRLNDSTIIIHTNQCIEIEQEKEGSEGEPKAEPAKIAPVKDDTAPVPSEEA